MELYVIHFPNRIFLPFTCIYDVTSLTARPLPYLCRDRPLAHFVPSTLVQSAL